MHPMLSVGSFGIFQCFIMFCSCQSLHMEGRGSHLWQLFLVLFGLGSALPVAGAFLPDHRGKFILQGFGNVFLGYALYYAAFLVLLKLLRGILFPYIKIIPAYMVFVVSLALALAVGTYGMIHAQKTQVTRLEVPVSKAGEKGQLRAALIGDLHLSVNTRYSTIEKMVELVNGEKPDVIFFVGDMFTSSYQGLKDPDRYASLLRQLKAPYGVYGVYGNHDVEEALFGGFAMTPAKYAIRTQEMEEFFQKAGFRMLEDEVVPLGDTGVQLVGRLDGEKAGDGTRSRMGCAELLSQADGKAPILVLEHEPTDYEALREGGADLVLSGHTHNGQIFPGNLLISLFHENAYGQKKIGGMETVVTSGVGFYGPPMRIGTDGEVMILNISFNVGGTNG